MDAPPEKRRRRLRPIEDFDWSLIEGMEGMNQKAEEFPSLERKEEFPAPSEKGESQVADVKADHADLGKLQDHDEEGATKKVVATLPSAAKSRARAKRKVKEDTMVSAARQDDLKHLEVIPSANGLSDGLAVPKEDTAEQTDTGAAKPALDTEQPNQAIGDAPAARVDPDTNSLTNGFNHDSEHSKEPTEPAAKARPRAKRRAKQEDSKATDAVEHPPKEADEKAVDQEEAGKKAAAGPPKRPRAKRKAKQDVEPAEIAQQNQVENASMVADAAPTSSWEPLETNSLSCDPEPSKETLKPKESAAKARPRAKRKAKEESKAPDGVDLPKELDKAVNTKSEEGKKEAEVTAKRPRAKRKAKQEHLPNLHTNGVLTNAEPAKDTATASEPMEPMAEPTAGTCDDVNRPSEVEDASIAAPSMLDSNLDHCQPPKDAEGPEVVQGKTEAEATTPVSGGDEVQVPDANMDDKSEAKDEIPGSGSVQEEDQADLGGIDTELDPSAFAAIPTLRRRRRVKVRRRRQAEFFVPEPVVFEPQVPEPPGPDPLKAAEEVLTELLQHQALLCKEVRISIEDRLQENFEEWRCQHSRINTSAEYCVRQVLDAVMQGQNADATTLSLAIEEAQQLGLPEKASITDRLEQLKKLEEVEGIWQCLSTCLRDADRLGVVFWSREAEQLGLEVPEVLTPALDAMREEEAARLKRMELEASFNAQATQAHARKDIAALRTMAQHAKANGQDPSAALAALEDLGEAEEVPDEEALERLFVSSPNGQNHCFGMYVLVREERGNGMPVWRQLGGERWIYTDELGRWTVGSSKVREKGFRGSAGFIYCPQLHHGILPDKMQFWARFDEEAKKWKKDEDITVASEYQEEVIEPKFSKRGKGKAAKKSAKGKGKGRGAKEEKAKARAKPKAAPRAEAKARPSFAQPAHQSGLTQPQAMRILELPAERLAELREEVINKAYRRLALKWHPDRHCNRLKKEEANVKFVELRNAFELMRDFLKAKKALQDVVL